MIKLLSDIQQYTNIVHLADIQIRLTKRHDEYREVFDRLFSSITKLPDATAVCVVGDIVHSKLDLSPECVQVTKEFLVGLANLRPTIIVAGNHDTNLTNKSRLDSLSPIVEAINHSNLFYLKQTGLYSLGDILFNNYSIFDDESTYLKGDKIPSIYRNEFRHLICLFHGTVDGAVSEMGFKLVNKNMPLSFFDHHDIVLLGDIHKVQDLQTHSGNKPAVHYCGSLIQQNHGEDLNGHGYSFWDLKSKTYTHIPIENDYGYFTVKVDKGEVKTDLTAIPKKARVRLSCYESLPTETKAVIKELKKITTLVEPPTYTREAIKEDKQSTLTINLIQGDIKNRDHQIKLLQEFLKNKLKIEDEGLIQEVIRINDETNSSIKTDDVAKNTKWCPIKFEFDNLFSFGEENVIDFSKAKEVIGLFAHNASGKSSIFSALSWCIFDKCERDFKANNIINDQKMSCRAKFEVDIGGVRYFIERTGKMDKKGTIKVNVRFWKVVEGTEEELTGIERSDTNNIIRAYLGNYEDFLLTSLSVQKSGKYETSFIDLGDSGRKDLLAQFLGLNLFDVLHENSNKKLNEIISTLKVYKNEDFEGELKTSQDTLSQTEQVWIGESKKLDELGIKINQLRAEITTNATKLITMEDIGGLTVEILQRDVKSNKNLIESHQEYLKQLHDERDDYSELLAEMEWGIKEFENKNIQSLYHQWQKLNEEKNKLNIELNQKIAEAKILKEKAKRIEDLKFDPNCKFCLDNAGNVGLESTKAVKELETYRPIIEELVAKKNEISNKLDGLKMVESDYQSYEKILKARVLIQEKYLSSMKKSEERSNMIEGQTKIMNEAEKKLEIAIKNKDAIISNLEVKKIEKELQDRLQISDYERNKQNKLVLALYGKCSTFTSKIDELKKKLEKVGEIEKQYKAYDTYVQAVSRDGIPYEVICSAVPHVENEVNSILNQMVDFYARFDIDGKNIIPYIVRDERHWLMSLGSGMEQFILSIAIRVALTNLSNLPKMNGIIIDEGFGVLDSEHLTSVQSLFHYLKTNFDFVVIISHLDVLRDMVDNHMEVKKDNGFSKVNFI